MAQDNEPVHKIIYGRIELAIWKNETDGRAWFNVEVTRRYKDGDQWKGTTSFGRDDLPVTVLALIQAYVWIWQRHSENGRPKKATRKSAE